MKVSKLLSIFIIYHIINNMKKFIYIDILNLINILNNYFDFKVIIMKKIKVFSIYIIGIFFIILF